MSLWEVFLTALDAIRANKVRTLLTTLGVTIGVLSVILLVSLGEGAQQYLAEKFAGLGSNLLQVTPGHRDTKGIGSFPLNTVRKLVHEDEIALRQRGFLLDGVTGIINGGGLVKYQNRTRDTMILGVGLNFDKIRELFTDQGRFFNEEDINSHRRFVIMGRVVLKELFGEEEALGKMLKVADREFRVIGITARKGTTLGLDFDDLVLIPNTTAMDLFALDSFNAILVKAKDRANVYPAIEEVRSILKSKHNNQEDFTIISQDDMLSTINGILATMKLILLAIASVSLLVGGIGIANIMLVSVRERTREIGIRRAVGAKKRHILLQFLFEAMFVSILGGCNGLLLGEGLVALARLASVPIQVSINTIFISIGFSAIVGVISGVAPARRAAQLDPVEALRYE